MKNLESCPRRALVRAALFLIASASALAGGRIQQAESRLPQAAPNLVVLMIDDLGWRDLEPAAWASPPGEAPLDRAALAAASPWKTPHIARLAAESVRFSEAYAAAPVCTPTRTSLMLGQEPARTGITYWTKEVDRDQSSPFPPGAPLIAAPAWRVNGIQPGTATLASRLQASGYRTIHVGKAHFGTGPGGDPTALGFDVNVAGWAAGGPGSYRGIDEFSAKGREERRGRPGRGSRAWDVPGLDAYHGQDVFLTDVLADEAVAAMRGAVKDEAPFFLHFAPYAVHAPLMPNPRVVDRFPGLEGPELAYASLIASVDDAVGAILGELESLGLAEDTLVVFTSDNGGLSAHSRGGVKHRHNAPLRSGKGSAYEGGVRVPLLVRWPGVTEPGRVAHGPVVTQDLFPTLLGAARVSAAGSGTTGVDLGPVLAGAGVPEIRPLLWHQPHYWGVAGPGIEPYSALRVGPWKLLYFHASRSTEGGGKWTARPRFELYDLHRDLSESRDLAGDEPAMVAALAEVLSTQLEAAGASMSVVLADGEPTPLPRNVRATSLGR